MPTIQPADSKAHYKFFCQKCESVGATCSDPSGLPFFIMRHYQAHHRGSNTPTRLIQDKKDPTTWTAIL